MCKFDIAWVGKCKKNSDEGKEYCEKHAAITCAICGEQATHECDETNQLVCGTPLCDKDECKLQHFYHQHGYAFFTIVELEKKLGFAPFKIVVSKVNYGTGKIAEWLNKEHKDRLEILLMTFNKDKQVSFKLANFRYYTKQKEEIPKLFRHSFYKDIVVEKGVYYSSIELNLENIYEPDILGTFEEVDISKSEEKAI